MQVGVAVARDITIESTLGPAVNPLALFPSLAVGADSVGGLLEQMASPRIAGLIAAIESQQATFDGSDVADLMHAAVAAVAAHDVPRALGAITELMTHYPEHLEGIRSEPAFASLRGDLESLLQRHVAAARADTEVKLSTATHAVGTMRDEVLTVAHELFATSRYANVLLAGELAQTVINTYTPVAVPVDDVIRPGLKRQSVNQLDSSEAGAFATLYDGAMKSLSERVPLLLIWLALGLISGLLTLVLRSFEVGLFSAALPLEIWGAGSAGFLGLGTYRRVRPRALPVNPVLGKQEVDERA